MSEDDGTFIARVDGSSASKELTAITSALRSGYVDLSYLSRPPADAQIEAMIDVMLSHTWDPRAPGTCDCGYVNPYSSADFKNFQRDTLRHLMADIVERVYLK